MTKSTSFADMQALISGFAVTAAISAAAQLGIADRLVDGPCSTSDLAAAGRCDAAFLRRLLRFLSTHGIFEALPNDRFAQTERSGWLRAGVAGSLRPRAVFLGSAMSWDAWGKLSASMRSGESGFREAFRRNLFDYTAANPEDAAAFNEYMAQQTSASIAAILAAYDFGDIGCLVDVGGGTGALIAGILKAYESMKGILFDLPEVVAAAGPSIDAPELRGRCQAIGGSFFDAVPAGGDCYLLKFILHDWNDEACVRILKACRQAMAANGRILIIEHILPEGPEPHFAHYMDLTMLIMTNGGRERTWSEFSALAQDAGLTLSRSFPTAIGVSVIEATVLEI